ncbi:EAL domain-containing protein [Hydrogenimonas sp.]
MIKNITLRFATVFVTFIAAGVFLMLTLQRSISLDNDVHLFQSNVVVPLDRLSEKARDMHIETLEYLLSKKSDTFPERKMGNAIGAEDETTKIFGSLTQFDNDYMARSLQSNIQALRHEWSRFKKVKSAFVRSLGAGGEESEAKKAVTNYMVAYRMLINSIDDLKKHFHQAFHAQIEEERDNIYATFYLSIIVAVATLVLLAFLLFEVNTINRKLQTYLEEREDYQEKLAKANKELAHYSEQLESEVKKRTEEAIDHLMKNPLTKLPNRLSFMNVLSKASHASVAIFNIDRFQSYNDLFGPKVGDKIIQDYAAYLRQTIPYIYEIYHLQGDEFAVVELDKKNANTFLAMIRQAAKLAREFHFTDANGDFVLQVSIGVAIDQRRPLVKADMALKHAKNSNESMVVYSDNLIQPHRYLENVTMTKELANAIKEERIVPYFQTIADTQTLEVYKYEVLARMVDNQGTVYAPGQFIPLAKQIRLYADITRIIFKKAMDVVEEHGFHVSINLSADDIHHLPTRNYIIDRLALSKYSDHITFELLESEETQNYEDIRMFIDKVKHYGVKIAIDDFGSGYSNFAKILKLKIDYLKIDGSFIKKIDTDSDSKEFVDIIYHLASNYNLKTVAEFVSNESVYETVKSMGIDYVQGYYIAKPMPLEEMLKANAQKAETLRAEEEALDWDA